MHSELQNLSVKGEKWDPNVFLFDFHFLQYNTISFRNERNLPNKNNATGFYIQSRLITPLQDRLIQLKSSLKHLVTLVLCSSSKRCLELHPKKNKKISMVYVRLHFFSFLSFLSTRLSGASQLPCLCACTQKFPPCLPLFLGAKLPFSWPRQ